MKMKVIGSKLDVTNSRPAKSKLKLSEKSVTMAPEKIALKAPKPYAPQKMKKAVKY